MFLYYIGLATFPPRQSPLPAVFPLRGATIFFIVSHHFSDQVCTVTLAHLTRFSFFIFRCKPRNGCRTAWLGGPPPGTPGHTEVHCPRGGCCISSEVLFSPPSKQNKPKKKFSISMDLNNKRTYNKKTPSLTHSTHPFTIWYPRNPKKKKRSTQYGVLAPTMLLSQMKRGSAIPYDSHCTDLKVGCDAYLGLVPMLYTARPLTIWVRPSLESSRLRELLKGQNSREDTVVKITKNLLEKSVGFVPLL